MKNEKLITYLFVNKSLNMSKGKVVVQTARASQVMLLNEINESDTYLLKSLNELFENDTMVGNLTICLEANSSQMHRILNGDINEKLNKLSKENSFPIRLYPVWDMGQNEVPENSLTVIAMSPVYSGIITPITKKFQLYK